MPDNTNIQSFLDMITADARELCEDIKKDTGRFVEKQINDAEKQALEESYNLIKSEVIRIRADAGAVLTKKRIEAAKQLLINRNIIKDNVFNKVREKLNDFTASDSYQDFLKKSLDNCCQKIGGNKFTVSIRECDKQYIRTLSSVSELEFKVDSTIKLGGIKVTDADGKLTADDTLDTRLENQYEWFYKNSGLVIHKTIG